MDLGLADANVVVGGGTKGMGLAAAKCFAADGANVAVLARGKEALDDTLVELKRLGSPQPLAIPTDLRDNDSIESAFLSIGQQWSRTVNTLVNAAGPDDGSGALDQVSDDGWISAFQMGALAAVRCVRACLPLIRAAKWGRIVNVSAHSVKRQTPGLVAYTASKAALTSISKNMSQWLAPEGIGVNTVSPGSFLSAGLRGYLEGLPPSRGIDPDDLYDAMKVIQEDFGHPAYMTRAGRPEEIGPVIAFVGSRLNSYMTGADINVDGGSDFS
jgi:NAD(P)-dependent dehydrogenase (short-subunit alcohol dehydrogenase family)